MPFDLQAQIIPDFGKVDEQIDKKEASIDADVEGKQTGGQGGQGGGGGGKGLGGIIQMALAATGIGAIISMLASLEPIQKALGAIMKVVKAFLAPFLMMGMRMLGPVLGYLMKLMMYWLKFWKDPIGNLKKAISGLFEGAGDFAEWIADKISITDILSVVFPIIGIVRLIDAIFGTDIAGSIWGILTSAVSILGDFGKWIWGKLKDLWNIAKKFGTWIWGKLKDLWNWGSVAVKGFGTWIWKQLKGLWDWTSNVGKSFGSWLWKQLKKIWDWASALPKKIGGFAEWLWKQITSAIGEGLDVLSNLGGIIKDWAIDVIKGLNPMNYIDLPDLGGGDKEKAGDFIVTSGGQFIETNPRDTIIGTKNPENLGGSPTINIQVDGVATDEIVDKMKDKLGREASRIGRY